VAALDKALTRGGYVAYTGGLTTANAKEIL
jgi:hypothetical protein